MGRKDTAEQLAGRVSPPAGVRALHVRLVSNQRWLSVTLGSLLTCAACAGARANKHERHQTAAAAPSEASAKPAFPYLEFDPDERPKADAGTQPTHAAPQDAAATDAGFPKVLPPPPSCKAVATTAPLSVDGDSLADSKNDPRLVGLRQYWRRLHQRNTQCSVGHNDGRLINLECASFYANADGNLRPGGVESHLFEWNGRRFEPVPLKQLFPGGNDLNNVLKEACNSTEHQEVYAKVWLDHTGMSFVAGLSPIDEAGCRITYAERADWVGCGPLAYLAGYAPRSPAPEGARPEPLGWDTERVMSRLPNQQALVRRINARIDGFYNQVKHAQYGELGCARLLSTNQVFSLNCSIDYSTKLRLNYSVPTGAELDIDTLLAVAGPRLIRAASAACSKKYGKPRPEAYGLFSKTPLKVGRDDLTEFELHSSFLRFHTELELQLEGEIPSKRTATCDVPLKAAGLSLEKLAAVPAPTP
ncbi:MAG: hypothetical protein H6718_09790 [Polyangiaceae bacterium]|nr:hypothetical protein [Myxococcales bacterium]MCB9585680.1 hypothetical protein [Polyangiaceae bacterium]MCB9607391.1 hypothetical protein [Polyangiaceae bacterium]